MDGTCPYPVVRPIRAGSPVSVFEAVDGGTPVVVKQLDRTRGAVDPIGTRRFEREVALSISARHPGLAKVHAHGEGWIAFERLEPPGRWIGTVESRPTAPMSDARVAPHSPAGTFSQLAGRKPPSSAFSPIPFNAGHAGPLRQAAFCPPARRSCWHADEGQDRGPRLAPAEVRRLVAALAEPLAYLHARGIVHRDVKPAHVMLRVRLPVLIDLGIAGLVADDPLDGAELAGSPAWMAPEQILGAKSAPPADIWSLAAVGASLARGAPLFSGEADDVLEERRRDAGQGIRLAGCLVGEPKLRALLEAGLGPAEGRPSAAEMARELGGG